MSGAMPAGVVRPMSVFVRPFKALSVLTRAGAQSCAPAFVGARAVAILDEAAE